MDKRDLLIELIQESLIGKLDSSANFNPQFLADAIIEKMKFNSTIRERNSSKLEEAIEKFNEFINDINNDMDDELKQLGKDEVLLKNFVNGQKTACEKLKDKLSEI